MTEQRTPRLRMVGRAVLAFSTGVLSLIATLAGLSGAALIVLTPKCPAVTPEYTVVATDVHGKLEYCVAEAQPVFRKPGMRNNVVHTDAACGPNKAELVAKAAAMSRQAEEDDKACNLRFLHEPHRLLLERGHAWYQFVVDRVRPWFAGA
ncbi:hypothetical protein WJ96_06275 [Burkholderia ubonensis]|uniref:Lipoprotein n=2 Tax=Burkholderia ubonensis TaxID=101571 RepID=A0AAW3MYV4_9BURK|nr:hypothetical protein WJ96_06275 [Burkholderia ubonensis]KVZ92873.1 hypothetical protein WL25_17940 [Burkholderia ubonensis]